MSAKRLPAEQYIMKKLSFAELHLEVRPVGEDIALLVCGGRPHIGCAVLAVPRASLAESEKRSCTSSVLNVTGHKDEAICRALAEAYCAHYGAVTVCTGGFHADGLTAEQLDEVMGAVRALTEEL